MKVQASRHVGGKSPILWNAQNTASKGLLSHQATGGNKVPLQKSSSKTFQDSVKSRFKRKIFQMTCSATRALYQNETTNLTVKFKNLSVKCHRFIFHVHSEEISKLISQLSKGDDVVVLHPKDEASISEQQVQDMIHFFYTMELELNDDNLENMIQLGRNFQSACLLMECASFMAKQLARDEEACLDKYFEMALEMEDSDLLGICFTKRQQMPDHFNEYTFPQVHALCDSDYLSMREGDILQRVMQYVDHRNQQTVQIDGRTKGIVSPLTHDQIAQLYACVRLPLMDPEILRKLVKPLTAKNLISTESLFEAFEFLIDPLSLSDRIDDKSFCKRKHPYQLNILNRFVNTTVLSKDCQTATADVSGTHHFNGANIVFIPNLLKKGTEILISVSNQYMTSQCPGTFLSKRTLEEDPLSNILQSFYDITALTKLDMVEQKNRPNTTQKNEWIFKYEKDGFMVVESPNGTIYKSLHPIESCPEEGCYFAALTSVSLELRNVYHF